MDLAATLAPVRRIGLGSVRRDADTSWWRATRTPGGAATTRMRRRGDELVVQAWGPGASWALEAAADACGARDSLEGFDPAPGIVRDLHRRFPGLRITRTRAVFEALAPTVLAQKVTGLESARAWRGLVAAFGEPAPGPDRGLRLPPSPVALAALPYHAFHRFGIEMRRTNVLRYAAARSTRLEEAAGMPLAEARRRLLAFPGIGAWTAAEVALVALGDADAVSVGDYHIPDTVAWALAGEHRGDDERMLELLAPYAGHRGRVIRLIEAAGIAAPRYGPKAAVRSFRDR